MTFEQFHKLVSESEAPVVLIEGTRKLLDHDAARLSAFGKWLAENYPHARFRTGNADGADTAFARGVADVDPARLEYVVPYTGHRKKSMATSAYQVSLTDLPQVVEKRSAYLSAYVSPAYDAIMDKRDLIPKLKAKAQYILRDTIKVTGVPEQSLPPATVGIFYVNVEDPMKGGTGHTIRVCQHQNVPVAFQDEWMQWPAMTKLQTKSKES